MADNFATYAEAEGWVYDQKGGQWSKTLDGTVSREGDPAWFDLRREYDAILLVRGSAPLAPPRTPINPEAAFNAIRFHAFEQKQEIERLVEARTDAEKALRTIQSLIKEYFNETD